VLADFASAPSLIYFCGIIVLFSDAVYCCFCKIQDLAEWGILIDHKETVAKIMDEYWNPMWEQSYTGTDCNVQAVMDGLDIDRDGEKVGMFQSSEQRKQQHEAAALQTGMGNSIKPDKAKHLYMDESGEAGDVVEE